MKQQRGFTLIEIVMVIAILGILAAVAIPKYVDLKTEANTAAVKGVAGALASASAIDYAQSKAKNVAQTGTTCVGVGALLTAGVVPAGYTIPAGTFPSCSVGNSVYTETWTGTTGTL